MRKTVFPAPILLPFRHAIAKRMRGDFLRNVSLGIVKLTTKISPGLPAGITEIRPLDMPDISFLPGDSMVMDAVYWFGVRGYEGIMSEVWQSLCARSHAVLEVGGNVGLFTVIGAGRAPGRYTVVEPVPNIAAILRENLLRNGLASVEVLQGAVVPDAAPCEVQLSIPDEGYDAPVGAHLVEGVEVSGRSELKILRVHGYPIVSLIAGRDLVKIDAEGIEARLLAAARDIIVRDKPSLVIEVLPEANQLGVLLAELAREAGYTIYIVPEYGSDEIVPVAPEDFSSALPQRYNSKDVVLSIAPLWGCR